MFFWDSLAVEKKDYYQLQFVRLFKALPWTTPHMFLAISTREISTAIIIHILRTKFCIFDIRGHVQYCIASKERNKIKISFLSGSMPKQTLLINKF